MLFVVLLVLVVTLGATGVSDRMLAAIVNEDLRTARQALAQTIRDPDELERVLAERREQLLEFYGLNRPWYARLPEAVARVLSLDLGSARTLRSFTGSPRVADLVLERLPNTVALVTSAAAITAAAGLFLGVRLAVRVGTRFDRAVSYLSAASNALPTWWTGVLLIIVFAVTLQIAPLQGMLSAPPPSDPWNRALDIMRHAALPVTTLVVASIGGWTYAVRTMVLNTSQEDFVLAARARGLPEGLVRRRHILRVAAPPIVTSLILGLAGSLGGAILTETVFNWPGMGRLFYDAILALDEPVIVALTFMYTLIYVAARFLLEVLYVFLDPRVRY